MKSIITAVGVVIIMSVLVNNREVLFYAFDNTAMYQKAETIEVEDVVEVEVDVIDSAKAELERINFELDEEETRLLDMKAQNQLEFDAKQLELENRLETIRETRTSF